MKTNLFLIAGTCAFLLATSCKKDETTATPNPSGTPEAAVVLKDGSGYAQSIDIVLKLTETNTGGMGKLGLYDFNIDRSNQLNLYYYDEWQSQQSLLKTGFRKAFDFSSKAEKTVKDATENPLTIDGYKTGSLEFMPYSSKLVSFGYSEARSGYYSQGFVGGDLSIQLPMAPAWQGSYSGGMGYYNAYAEQKTNGGKHYLLVQLIEASSVLALYEYLTPAMPMLGSVRPDKPVLAQFPEPRHMPGQGKSVVISVRADSVMAYSINNVMSPAKVYTLTGSTVSTGLDKTLSYTVKRNYSADGKKMAMMVFEPIAKKYWTYTYDFTADQLAPVLNAADLPYSAEGSDIDLDENGNIYYSGVAGNGGNSAGVSIYKRTASGVSLVGKDDFLKFGEIVKLRYLKGKVHLAITGNISGVKAWAQLSIISQQ